MMRKVYEKAKGDRMVRVYYDNMYRDYRVRLFIAGEPQDKADYFTDDNIDALNTAGLMLKG